jgi:hypothetical protein
MKYKLIKDWESKRHGTTISEDSEVLTKNPNERGDTKYINDVEVFLITDNELKELRDGEYIEAPKKKKKKKTE